MEAPPTRSLPIPAMVILDATIVLGALPSIQADIGFSKQGWQWVLSAYALTFGGLLLLGGRGRAAPGPRSTRRTRARPEWTGRSVIAAAGV